MMTQLMGATIQPELLMLDPSFVLSREGTDWLATSHDSLHQWSRLWLWSCDPCSSRPRPIGGDVTAVATKHRKTDDHDTDMLRPPQPPPPPPPPPVPGMTATYHGGPLLSELEVTNVWWGPSFLGPEFAPTRDALDAFLDAILDGPYLWWLAEYNSGGEVISKGPGNSVGHRVGTSVLVPTMPTETDVDPGVKYCTDLDVESMLESMPAEIFHVPHGPKQFYIVFIDPAVQVGTQGRYGCGDLQGFHFWSYKLNAACAVIPWGCSAYPGDENNAVTGAITHELIEAITDPRGNSWQAPYQAGEGEICDACNYEPPRFYKYGDYYVASFWSNKYARCLEPKTGFII